MKKLLLMYLIASLILPNLLVADVVTSETYGNQYGTLTVYPDVSDGIITQEQFAVFDSNITAEVDVAFRFNFSLSNHGIWAWRNYTHYVKTPVYEPKTFNYTLINISDFELLDYPNLPINLGDETSNYYATGNASYFDVEFMGWDNGTHNIGFDTFEWLNQAHTECFFTYEDAAYFSHYSYIPTDYYDWLDVSGQFNYVVYNNRHYYYVSGVTVVQGQTYNFKWQYDVPLHSDGKWDLFVKYHDDTLQYALENNRYVMIDPWWNSSWQYHKILYLDNPLLNYQVCINVTNTTGGDVNCEGHAQPDFDDIRFLYNNATELPYWRENYTVDTYARFWINNTVNTSVIEMYYGNSTVTTTSNGTTTFIIFDDFEDYVDEEEPKASKGWTLERPNDAPCNYWWAETYDEMGRGGTIMKGASCGSNQTGQHLMQVNFSTAGTYSVDFWARFNNTDSSDAYQMLQYEGDKATGTLIWHNWVGSTQGQRIRWYDGGSYNNYVPDYLIPNDVNKFFMCQTYKNDNQILNETFTHFEGGIRNNPTNGISTQTFYCFRKQICFMYIDDFRIRNWTQWTKPSWNSFSNEFEYTIPLPFNVIIYPFNNTIDICPCCFEVNVTFTAGFNVNITYYSNYTGSWISIDSYINVSTGSYGIIIFDFTHYSWDYWLNITVCEFDNDSNDVANVYKYTTSPWINCSDSVDAYSRAEADDEFISSDINLEPDMFLFVLWILFFVLWFQSESESMNVLLAIIFVPYTIFFTWYALPSYIDNFIAQMVFVGISLIVLAYSIDLTRKSRNKK